MPCDPIEQQIVDALKAFAPYAYQRNFTKEQWTLGVTGLIGAIGWRNGYSFCARKMSNQQDFIIKVLTDIQNKLGQTLYDPEIDRFVQPQSFGEFLYDVTWLKYDINYKNKHRYDPDDFSNRLFNRVDLIDAPLVAESDWGNFGNIKEDFEKLLLARSKYRVMVFDNNTENNIRDYTDRLIAEVRQSKLKRPSDRYLFCGAITQLRRFNFELLIVP